LVFILREYLMTVFTFCCYYHSI